MRKIVNKETEIVLKNRIKTEKVKCDMCDKEGIPIDEDIWPRDLGVSWPSAHHQTLLTNLSYIDKWNYPDEGYGEIIHYDICHDCFKNKLLPVIQTLVGSQPHNLDRNSKAEKSDNRIIIKILAVTFRQ